jgi:hypothetical protein
MPAHDAAPVSGVFPAGASFHLLEIRVQAIQLLAISRGSRNAPSHTPGHGRYFPGMLLSPSGFPSRSAIRPRNLPPSSSRLRRGYNTAPRGADAADADDFTPKRRRINMRASSLARWTIRGAARRSTMRSPVDNRSPTRLIWSAVLVRWVTVLTAPNGHSARRAVVVLDEATSWR